MAEDVPTAIRIGTPQARTIKGILNEQQVAEFELIEIQRLTILHIQITTAPGYDWLALVYYLAKLDHLLCVPALFMLFMGLRRLLREHTDTGGLTG